MGKKVKKVFVCQECGYESPKWMGQCICGAWNSMFEEKIPAKENDNRRYNNGTKGKPSRLSEIEVDRNQERIDTGINELNRVLGGGLVNGSLTLISGEPGIGKSTMIMQTATNIAKDKGVVLYVTGEESEEQIKLRADRICGDVSENVFILAETNLDNISIIVEELKPVFLIIDSIQTMYTEEIDSAPGSVSQVRTCGNELMKIGKVKNVPIFIVAHVTKNGELAGPKIIEHLVDCVLNFSGERNGDLRILRSFKNRFGTTSEIGAFEMSAKGLIEIEDLSKRFLEELETGVEGAMVTAIYEGTRPLLLEIQALAATTNLSFARRTTIGIDGARLNMILAVLEKRTSTVLVNQDIYINVVGGLRPEGTSTDLAVALAIYSSFRGILSPQRTLALGEIGLTGDLKAVSNAEKIVKEAIRMGFKKIILPANQAKKLKGFQDKISLVGVENICQAIDAYSK